MVSSDKNNEGYHSMNEVRAPESELPAPEDP